MKYAEPFLSIGIPTYNRCEQLKKTLLSITGQEVFQKSHDVEIIISDNASTDCTENIGKEFASAYPDKIFYFRQPIGIDGHFNFQFVLDHGSGRFLKLHTDSTMICPGELDKMVSRMKKYPDAGAIITHTLKCQPEDEKELRFDSINEALQYCSLSLTTITLHAYNRDLYRELADPFRYYQLYFPHLDIFFRLMETGRGVVVLDGPFYEWLPKRYVQRNDAFIFGECYPELLRKYVAKDEISLDVMKKEKRAAYFWAIIPNYFDFHHNLLSEPCQGYRVFWKCTGYYRNELYFYLSLPCIFVYRMMCDVPILSKAATFVRMLFLKLQNSNYARRIALAEEKARQRANR